MKVAWTPISNLSYIFWKSDMFNDSTEMDQWMKNENQTRFVAQKQYDYVELHRITWENWKHNWDV